MEILTLKIPKALKSKLSSHARQKGTSQSEIVRKALTEFFSKDDIRLNGSFVDYAQDLVGSVEGPQDLSSNKKYLDDYGR